MAINWIYDSSKHVFRNADTGRKLTPNQLIKVRDGFVAAQEDTAKGLVDRYAAGEMTQAELQSALSATTSETMTAMSVIGAGGVERVGQMGSEFTSLLQDMLDYQGGYFDQFMTDLANGIITNEEAAQRASLYQSAAINAYEQASAQEAGISDALPYFAGDWGTPCASGCRCSWIIDTVFEGGDQVTYATWQTEEDGRVCDGCEQRAKEWPRTEIDRVVGAAPQIPGVAA
jgi:hypothetical protein